MAEYDVAVVGGGIVGVATGRRLAQRYPHLSIALLEKEDGLARHQTGRNSGVIHAGIYYKPGSLKARFCKAGVEATTRFCTDHGIPFEQCGKMIVATEPEDLPRLSGLYQRGLENGMDIERIDAAELSRREPHITGRGAIFVRTTGIVDYGFVARKMGDDLVARGGDVLTGGAVTAVREDAAGVTMEVGGRSVRARHAIFCAGIMADRMAKLCGLELDFQLVPFRGEYYRLRSARNGIVNHLIYPVPDPALPFLGVHLTRMIGGFVTVGPNAVLAFGRESYRFGDVNLGDMCEYLGYGGFRKLARNHMRLGLSELHNSLSKRRYLALCRRYCPELTLADFEPHPSGIRAQAVMADGSIEHDFIIRGTSRSIHVCNAPSPAATSAIPIADHVVQTAASQFGWQ
ncbi:L-2-hydroxyglutarate oxidase [Mesorhizobium sp. CU2]|uniref:L-2-hydroxyglutarate oxidase n=1 Tax=unclassified Mesorhizobium TaxID=325217 RepID=UPI001128AF27|nr:MULTISPECIES: L-2-hydroxyglutarate oxidase [unclassified Mesorhizobium]TPN81087.1 L-2-hydroxyglutarate oxidase [Mesorhizobium sp. CU3]TPO11692.1 L-2-hydroxyglutarate oxidase [Mesorhizobium sp. CU2]